MREREREKRESQQFVGIYPNGKEWNGYGGEGKSHRLSRLGGDEPVSERPMRLCHVRLRRGGSFCP